MEKITYKQAGVDQTLGKRAKESIKDMARSTFSKNVLAEIGLFSGLFELNSSRIRRPVLVSSMDGVGSKIKIAQMMGVYQSLGEDLVNHCVNDVMTCGADPLFFLDYLAADKLNIEIVKEIVQGLSGACKNAGCALIGGETAEMPGIYVENNLDIAGCMVGLVEKNEIIDGSKIQAGDILVGIGSNGLHTNGYSLARKIFFEVQKYSVSHYLEETRSSIGEELLKSHRSYQNLVKKVRYFEDLHGIAHITGGGLVGNIKRLLRDNLDVQIDWQAWRIPPIFQVIQREGKVPASEMREVFNLGIGLVLIVQHKSVDTFLNHCKIMGEQFYTIGTIIKN
ncbi:MAG: phosphoribosylformylglycinamidine cyclo-ligase [bacterium]